MSIANRISTYNRERKWRLFLEEVRPDPRTRVLDVGYEVPEHSPSANFIEKHYPYKEQLTALGIDSADELRRMYPEVRAVQYDGDVFPFEDNEFDVCWSNGVLEHVGDKGRQLQFLRESQRVARKTLVTTPNRSFPIEIHTRVPLAHYLPKPVFDAILRRIGKSWATGDYMNVLSARRLEKLLLEAGIRDFQLIKNRLLGLTVDFVAIF